MSARRPATSVIAVSLLAVASMAVFVAVRAEPPSAGAAAQADASTELARGHYLVRAGDCTSCHTAHGGKPFAGSRPIATPFGTIWTPNITPDKATGIGNWTEKDFYRALHFGKDNQGNRLYPAMPYPSYTKLSRADVHAMWVYLRSVVPVHQTHKSPDFPWPMSWRFSMVAWNLLYFSDGEYKNDPKQSAQWNRGAYLAEALEHCGACHTPRNFLGGPKSSEKYQGGNAGLHWHASSLDPGKRSGIGDWSEADLVQYLKTGANAKAAAAGPMSEVISNSTQHLTDADLTALAVYLKQRPHASEKDSPQVAALDQATQERGQTLYVDNCTACHMANGRGVPKVFPSLVGNSMVQSVNPGSTLHLVLQGGRMAAPTTRPTGLAMPGFGWKLSDTEVADVVSYIRHSWGNRAPKVDADTVAAVRKDLKATDNPSGHAITHPNAYPRPELWQPVDNDSQMPIKPVVPAAAASTPNG